jgi:ubiquinone/menaquinone biosynthesis C-methylase UbiE
MSRTDFQPALGLHALTPYYDLFHTLVDPGDGFRFAVAAHLALLPGERVLDVASGTGSLALVLKRLVPEAEVAGIDIDPAILAIARRKAERAGLDVAFSEASADHLPFADASFDRVVSSLAFHHLEPEVKRRAFREAHRVLRPGGRFLLVDFGGIDVPLLRAAFNVLHGEKPGAMQEHVAGAIPPLLREAGFVDVQDRHVMYKVVHFFLAARAA